MLLALLEMNFVILYKFVASDNLNTSLFSTKICLILTFFLDVIPKLLVQTCTNHHAECIFGTDLEAIDFRTGSEKATRSDRSKLHSFVPT